MGECEASFHLKLNYFLSFEMLDYLISIEVTFFDFFSRFILPNLQNFIQNQFLNLRHVAILICISVCDISFHAEVGLNVDLGPIMSFMI